MTKTYTTLDGTILTTNEANTHFYAQPKGGVKTRIKRAEFEQIIIDDELERKEWNIINTTPVNELRAVVEAEREAEEAHEEAAPVEESSSTTPAPKTEEKPKKKARKAKKNVAFRTTIDGVEITLTDKQVDFIKHLPDSNFWEDGVNSVLWCDVLADEIGGQFAGKPMTTGAMISTICEKGLGIRTKDRVNGRKCTAFALTEKGKQVARTLGLW